MRAHRRNHSERGQTLIIFALAIALYLFGLICLVVDLSTEYGWAARVQASAQIAAQSGANDINPDFLYYGPPSSVLCVGGSTACSVSAVTACQRAGDQSAAAPGGTTCRTNADSRGQMTCVHADISKTVSLPLPLFGATSVVRSSFDAQAVPGTEIASRTAIGVCPGVI